MKINPAIFKAYDIRGIYPTEINENNIIDIIKAICTFFAADIGKSRLKIILGRDMRLSSPSLFAAAKKTLIEMGATVGDVGLVSTPTFYFSVLYYQYDAGIQISASHNPKDYNGIKFVKRVGENVIKIGKRTGMDKVKSLAQNKKYLKSSSRGRLCVIKDAVNEEVEFAFKLVRPKNIQLLKIVADPANSMAILYLEEMFRRLPCKLIRMNFQLDGTFPAHQPDPMNFKNLVGIEKKVVEEKADLGIAPDGDGDRLFFIDEKGKVIKASLITSVIANQILKQNKKEKVIIDIRYTQNIANAVKKAGGIPVVGKVGHALITDHMHREKAIFSGESSGHYFYRATGYAENSVLTILYLLEVMGIENKPISAIVSRYLTSFESGEVNFILKENVSGQKLMKLIAKDYSDAKISWLDGVAADYPNWRFNIRASNTEPLIRLNIEASQERITQIKLKELKAKIIKVGAIPKD